MEKDNNEENSRRNFLAGAGLVTAGAAMLASSNAAAQANSGFNPERHDEDAWMEIDSKHRVFVDSSSGPGGIQGINYASNILRAHAMGYNGKDSDYSIILCFRHDSSPFGFNSAMWEKYHELFMRRTQATNADGSPVTVNPLTVESSPYGNRSNTVANMAERGVHFAICNLSTLGMAGGLARATGKTSEEVYAELIANTVPNGQIVPAGVMASTRAQEFGYTYMYSA